MDTSMVPGKSSDTPSWEIWSLRPDQFDHYWSHIEACLDEQPELWEPWTDKAGIVDNIHSGAIQAWVVSDSEAIRIVILSQVGLWPNGKRVFQVFWAYGQGLMEVLPMLDLAFDDFARKLNCSVIEITGRKGWERVLRPLGGVYKFSMFHRPVRARKGN